MNFLIIAQDLRVSGTSEGIVSRSFIANLRETFPKSVIDILYLKKGNSDDLFHLLPYDSIQVKIINHKVPFLIKWANKIYWRLFHVSLKERFINKIYNSYIKQVDYKKYDHIFIRSSGLDYETVLGAKGLSILEKSIINFHDPYPVFWDAGSRKKLTKLDLFRLKEMQDVVVNSKCCITPSKHLSEDLGFLYNSKKEFKTLPHQFNHKVFDLTKKSVRNKKKNISISYHGTLQLGRDIDIILDAYMSIVNEDKLIAENSEIVLRLKSNQFQRLKEKYKSCDNIVVLEAVSFSESFIEQRDQSNILILLENSFNYSHILIGKAPVVSKLNKRFLCVSPSKSELRRILKGHSCVVSSIDFKEIKKGLKSLIIDEMNHVEYISPFKEYFEIDAFKKSIQEILAN